MGVIQTESAQQILGKLAQHLPQLREMGVARIGLFGSGVRGELTPESDLDFLVDMADKSFRAYLRSCFFLKSSLGERSILS
jgi:predicted nucleotidyltransferase